ncbi:TPA: phage tail protein I, partial [Escherichia coli]|nr:phage tail protein I [Escherichia coli]
MSDSRLLPTGSSPLEVAAAKACAEIEKTPVSIRELWNPDTCPANLLPWLAWSFSVDRWDDKWPEATKRAVIRDAYFIHCHKGTTGEPKAPTPAAGNNTTRIATTAFVQAAITALINGAPATLDTLKEIAVAINNDPKFSTTINNALALKAPLSSPALTGTPTAPTAAQSVNNTQIATTAFVKSAIAAMVGSAPAALDTLNELAAALGNDPNFSTTVLNALAGKQPLDNTLTNLSGKDVAGL